MYIYVHCHTDTGCMIYDTSMVALLESPAGHAFQKKNTGLIHHDFCFHFKCTS